MTPSHLLANGNFSFYSGKSSQLINNDINTILLKNIGYQ